MKIKKKGLIWNIAFYWRRQRNQPENQVSLCKLFWNFLFGLFIAWPLMSILISVVATIAIIVFILLSVIVAVLGFWVARRPDLLSSGGDFIVPYEHWPTIYGHRVYPISVIFAVVAIYYGIYMLPWTKVSSGISASSDATIGFFMSHGGMFSLGIACAIAIITVAIGIQKFWRSEVGVLFREYASAVHQKVCPLVEIIPAKPKEKKV